MTVLRAKATRYAGQFDCGSGFWGWLTSSYSHRNPCVSKTSLYEHNLDSSLGNSYVNAKRWRHTYMFTRMPTYLESSTCIVCSKRFCWAPNSTRCYVFLIGICQRLDGHWANVRSLFNEWSYLCWATIIIAAPFKQHNHTNRHASIDRYFNWVTLLYFSRQTAAIFRMLC